jgi:hypothetical protein
MGDALLALTIIDGGTGSPTPARVEVTDASGRSYVARDALKVPGDCADHPEPVALSLDEALQVLPQSVKNLFTQTTQFYSAGRSEILLDPGRYRVRASKGPEYRAETVEVDIADESVIPQQIRLERWVDMPATGWFSADDHLHIARSVAELNPVVLQVMQAEDIHVANLLQFGIAEYFHNCIQYSLGDNGIYQDGDYILAGGQENPRTHFLGHSIVLGAQTGIHLPDEYLVYRLVWEEARRQGGLSGWAHFGTDFLAEMGGQYGLPMSLPHGLLNFIEVLQFNGPVYIAWYDMLNLGFRVTCTAGTDYPCGGANIPGRERFYTHTAGRLSYPAWLEAVRRGRTFVTNGPIVEFRVQGSEIGDDLTITRPGSVLVEAKVRFDPTTDDVRHVELVENGVVVHSIPRREGAAEVDIQFEHEISETAWLALRVTGSKLGEPFILPALRSHQPTSAAHTGPIYITLEGAEPLWAHRRSRDVARTWLARLDDLDTRLSEDRVDDLAERLARLPFDRVPAELLRRSRRTLRAEIESARAFFLQRTTS